MVCGLRGVTKKPIRTASNLRKLNIVGAFLISQFRAFYVCNEMKSDFHYRLIFLVYTGVADITTVTIQHCIKRVLLHFSNNSLCSLNGGHIEKSPPPSPLPQILSRLPLIFKTFPKIPSISVPSFMLLS